MYLRVLPSYLVQQKSAKFTEVCEEIENTLFIILQCAPIRQCLPCRRAPSHAAESKLLLPLPARPNKILIARAFLPSKRSGMPSLSVVRCHECLFQVPPRTFDLRPRPPVTIGVLRDDDLLLGGTMDSRE